MKRLTGIALGASLIAVTITASAGCALALGNAPDKSQPLSPYVKTAEDFVQNGSTYRFDGIEGSLKVVKAVGPVEGTWDYTVEYQTRQPGHGDRAGQSLAQVITAHTAEIEIRDGKVTSAICDGSWDMAANENEGSLGEELTLPAGQSQDISGEGVDLIAR